jgi:hypothetical protein
MKKEEIIKEIELNIKEWNGEYELNLVDFIEDFFKKRKITPQEEIDERLKLYIENYTNVQIRIRVEYDYRKLILMRDNPNWKEELKEEYKNNFKKFLILGVIPFHLLTWGIGFVMDGIASNGVFEPRITSNLIYFQLWMLNFIIPIFIYNPKIYFKGENYDIVYSEILRRYNIGGNLLFFSSLISIFIKSWTLDFEDSITWGDIRCFVIPFCIGFVFFYNSFLKNIKK